MFRSIISLTKIGNNIHKIALTLILSAFSFTSIFSVSDPMKFGKVDSSLLKMKVYDKDTTAEAIVICDFGDFNSNDISFKRLYRLKILKKSGCDRANFVMNVDSKSNFRGITFNLVNGIIVKDKLKSESIFEEEITKNHYRYRLAMPNVQVGSVLDIEATFFGIPYAWYFQSDIPVIWSELRIPEFSEVGIQKNFFGFQYLSINERDRWVGKDMPALKKEPYMNNIDNFFTKLELEFTHYRGYTFATTWLEANNFILNKSTLGDELKTIFFMSSDAGAIKDSCKTIKDKMTAAYETIRKKMKWNEDEFLYPQHNIKYSLNKGSGNAGEVNLALLLLLKKLDIECYPVGLSTRDNGMLTFFNPALFKLNYLIVLAKINSQDILLDATEDYLPAGYLPERCINGNGRIIDDNIDMWVDLKPGGNDKQKLFADLKIDENGNATGNLSGSFADYGGYLFRKKFSSFNDSSEFIKSYERENPGLKINSSHFVNINSIYSSVNTNYSIEYKGNSDVTDSTITFLPFMIDRLLVNPFKSDERKIPVDFIYSSEKRYVFRYQIPANYKIISTPEAVKVVLPNNSGKFTYNISTQDSVIMLNCNISISKVIFAQDEYPNLKQFYTEIVKKQSEPIIIKKK